MVAAVKRGEGSTGLFVAPTGGVTIHVPVLIGNVLVIPLETKAQTLTFTGAIDGVWEIDAASADVIAAGDLMSWSVAGANIRRSLTYTEVTGDLNGCAVAVEAKISTVTRVKVRINAVSGNVV